MIYTFKLEDRKNYEFLENAGITPNLKLFLEEYRPRMKTAFEQLLEEMKYEEKNERKTEFIQEMKCEEFIEIVEYAFCIMFSKDTLKMIQNNNDIELSILAAYQVAEKMRKNAQESSNAKLVDNVIAKCCNSVLSAYRADN